MPPVSAFPKLLRAAISRHLAGLLSFVAFFVVCAAIAAYSPQNSAPQAAPAPPQPGVALTPEQLDDLVAPVALYPDPLLAQLLAASTYPLEIVEAEQWLHDHTNWKGKKLLDEAKKQKWDPSVQGLVAFPDVLAQLSQDTNWTTQLGNAFLGNQADVMQAVQRMRQRAEQKGTLKSTPQATVATQNENGQQVITIEPTNPDMWYVPNYNPVYIWGPPVWGIYPPLLYPGIGIGFGWFPGIDVGLYFGGWGGWGWGGWGWAPNWFGGGIFIDHSFFHRYGFHDYGGAFEGRGAWVHDPAHRLGVPYPNRAVADRFARPGGFGAADRFAPSARGVARGSMPAQHFGTPSFEQRGFTQNHSVFGGYHNGGMTRMQSDRGFSSMGGHMGGFGGFHGGGGRR